LHPSNLSLEDIFLQLTRDEIPNNDDANIPVEELLEER